MGAVKLCGPREMAPYCVLLMIADEADDFGVAIIGREKLAQASRCDERTVDRALEKLEAGGWLCVRRRLWRNKCNVYFVNLEKIGVILSPDARLSGFHLALRKLHGDNLSPIFAEKPSEAERAAVPGAKSVQKPVEPFFSPDGIGDTAEISGDIPQGEQATSGREQVTLRPGIGDKLCHPSLMSRTVPDVPEESVVPAPLPPTGGEAPAAESPIVEKPSPAADQHEADLRAAESWSLLKFRLKQELNELPRNRFFRPVKPDETDYDACFRDWWLAGLQHDVSSVTFRTEASDARWTRPGIAKHHLRLERLAREIFHIPRTRAVTFTVQQPAEQAA